MSHPFRAVLSGLLLIALVVGTGGCDSATFETPPESSSQPSQSESRMRVLLTDAPIGNIEKAFVTINRVELVGEGGTTVLSEEEQTFDLLTLQDGKTAPLADLTIPDGDYHQLRLIVGEEARVVLTDGSEQRLKVPGGAQTGIKLNLSGLSLEGGDAATITVDFDAGKSFVKAGKSGKYIFKPVIKTEAVEIDDDNGDEDDGEEAIELEGAVTAVSEDRIEVEGFSFERSDATEIDEDEDTLSASSFVDLSAVRQSDGSFLATDVKVEDESDEAKLETAIEEVTETAVAALGASFEVTSDTELSGLSDVLDLSAGDRAEIEFSYDAEAETYQALEIEAEEEDDGSEDEDDDEDSSESDA